VAALHNATPAARILGRRRVSPRRPNSGAVTVYTSRKVLPSNPSCVSLGWKDERRRLSSSAETT